VSSLSQSVRRLCFQLSSGFIEQVDKLSQTIREVFSSACAERLLVVSCSCSDKRAVVISDCSVSSGCSDRIPCCCMSMSTALGANCSAWDMDRLVAGSVKALVDYGFDSVPTPRKIYVPSKSCNVPLFFNQAPDSLNTGGYMFDTDRCTIYICR